VRGVYGAGNKICILHEAAQRCNTPIDIPVLRIRRTASSLGRLVYHRDPESSFRMIQEYNDSRSFRVGVRGNDRHGSRSTELRFRLRQQCSRHSSVLAPICRSHRLHSVHEMIHEEFQALIPRARNRCAGPSVIFKADTAKSRNFRSAVAVTPAFSSLSTDNFPSERQRNESSATSCQRKLHLASRHVSTHLALVAKDFLADPFAFLAEVDPPFCPAGSSRFCYFVNEPRFVRRLRGANSGSPRCSRAQLTRVSISTLCHEKTRE